ncbi:type II CAAX endopeptidase family protein [Mucilaginibacter sp.]|uniref:CPBP family intramembrane glutamic endopeptidase n=1 Tax=Mucilaginibacter sp. TaxID=1882438 RepID=UPI0025D7CF15|nr:type II CAAX endopeptidase family protein [Mucilaginibacter sp.]
MEQPVNQSRKAIAIFLLITLCISSIYYFLIIHTGKLGSGFGLYVAGIMWAPALSAFATCRIMKRNIADLGWSWKNPRYMLWAYLVPLIYSLIAYLILWVAGWGGFYNTDTVKQIGTSFGWAGLPDGVVMALYFIFTGLIGMVGSTAHGLGEEIGWRGFLVPEVYKISNYTKTSLFVGFVWALWHVPILVFADYNSGTPAWYGFSCFGVMVISISFIFTWFRLKSGNLWTAAILHASHNLFIQSIFTPLTVYNSKTKYYIDEFGVVLAVVAVIAAIYFWTRRKELPQPGFVEVAAA